MNFEPVSSKSGNIVSAGYDAEQQRAVVKFKGGTAYEYSNVPPQAWSAFSATFGSPDTSTGSYFNQHIKKFPCQKL